MYRPLAGGYPHILTERESERPLNPAYFLPFSVRLTASTPCEKLRDFVSDERADVSPRHSLPPPPPTTVLGLPPLAIPVYNDVILVPGGRQ